MLESFNQVPPQPTAWKIGNQNAPFHPTMQKLSNPFENLKGIVGMKGSKSIQPCINLEITLKIVEKH